MPSTRAWLQMIGVGAALCIGGPALVIYVSPSEEELFKSRAVPKGDLVSNVPRKVDTSRDHRYNPELQRRSLRNRADKQQEFDDFVGRLKVAAKSDKNIWDSVSDIEAQKRQESKDAAEQQKTSTTAELERRRREMKTSPGG